jgi:hypothetical protein
MNTVLVIMNFKIRNNYSLYRHLQNALARDSSPFHHIEL